MYLTATNNLNEGGEFLVTLTIVVVAKKLEKSSLVSHERDTIVVKWILKNVR